MSTGRLAQCLNEDLDKWDRVVKVRLNGKLYLVSHVEHKDADATDVVVIYDPEEAPQL
jgi:hypothetical protein